MGGPCEVLIDECAETDARHIAEAAAAVARRIEARFSRYRFDSAISAINLAAGQLTRVDEETADLIDFAASVHHLSQGLFDITSGVLRKAWTFDGGSRVPSDAEIAALLPFVGWHHVEWRRPEIRLREGMQLDFGGIGKEYAVDCAIEAVRSVSSTPTLVNFGGDLAVTGPRKKERPWRVGIESVRGGRSRASGVLELREGAVATSGDTHRFVSANGIRLPHILDPRTGRPIESAPHSITVAAAACTQAGMLATLAMLRGTGAEEFLGAEEVRFWIQRE